MLPNLFIPSYKLFGVLPIEPFGVLVALAVTVGYWLGRRRARLVGLDPELCADGMVWMAVIGFVVAHVVSVVFYFPEKILEDPLVLIAVWSGISSFGGILGGVATAWWFFHRHGVSALRYADAIVFGFVPAWILGRLGCTIVFDHKGLPTDFWLGMADRAGVVHHNLGLYELFVALLLTALLYALRRVQRGPGFFCALMLLVYSPLRFGLDWLRTADRLYWGLTPGQYFAVLSFFLGAGLLVRALRPPAPGPAAPPTGGTPHEGARPGDSGPR
ncbi:MAG: prolipoprotein diacylglyceryl transferase [Proteobacteria bacterium]|nr:prolipoprotein diacylglyceryl transferase [Pseudomonadota bacterium]